MLLMTIILIVVATVFVVVYALRNQYTVRTGFRVPMFTFFFEAKDQGSRKNGDKRGTK